MVEELEKFLINPYIPEYNKETKKFEYPKDLKVENYAECPECGSRIYDKRAISVVKCNICGTIKSQENKTDKKRSRCMICSKKRLTREYINEKKEIKRLCDSCVKIKIEDKSEK